MHIVGFLAPLLSHILYLYIEAADLWGHAYNLRNLIHGAVITHLYIALIRGDICDCTICADPGL
jgi:hypothetical protein